MATQEDLRTAQSMVPWTIEEFQDGLEQLSESRRSASRAYAEQMKRVAALTWLVPRCLHDERGATPWTSLSRELSWALAVTEMAAARAIRYAEQLTTNLPVTLHLLETAVMSVPTATALLAELEAVSNEIAREIDLELAERMCALPAWRVKHEVQRAVLRLDPDAAADQASRAAAARGVRLYPLSPGQACVELFGPAVAATTYYTTVDARARALKAAGDPRPLAALRFDLATASFPCATHVPVDSTAEPTLAEGAPHLDRASDRDSTADRDLAAGGLRPSCLPAPPPGATGEVDCRRTRAARAMIVVPVETALGLSSEPGWLSGYGYLDAPTTRLLLPEAELRQVCVGPSGQLLDLAARPQRPPPTPTGIRDALLQMATTPVVRSDVGTRTEPGHDPSPLLSLFVHLRDRFCDGGTALSAAGCHLDHGTPWPHGPTAAWNLAARATRTHQLKHDGWTPDRTPLGTWWTSPAGQRELVPTWTSPPPGIDVQDTPDGQPGLPTDAVLPDPDWLAALDTYLATPANPSDALPRAHPSQHPDRPFPHGWHDWHDDPHDPPF